jgi:GT2 family glycosyltransferase
LYTSTLEWSITTVSSVSTKRGEKRTLIRIAVIILNWNDASATIACCQSVVYSLQIADPELDIDGCSIWLVDNGSSKEDASHLVEWCQQQRNPHIQLLRNSTNLGYAAGMNQGIAAAFETCPDFFLLLNNDLLLDKKSITALARYSRSSNSTQITGITVLDKETGLIQSAGGYRYYPSLAYSKPLLAGRKMEDLESLSMPVCDYVGGAAMWLRANFLQRIDGLPEEHFLYFEELELAQKLCNDEYMGYCQQAIASHHGGGSQKTVELQAFAAYHAALSAFEYTWTHYPWFLPSAVIARLAGLTYRAILRRQPNLALAGLKAFASFVKS